MRNKNFIFDHTNCAHFCGNRRVRVQCCPTTTYITGSFDVLETGTNMQYAFINHLWCMCVCVCSVRMRFCGSKCESRKRSTIIIFIAVAAAATHTCVFIIFICLFVRCLQRAFNGALRILVELLTDDDDAAFCNVQNKSMDAAAAAGFFSSRV